MTEQRLTTLLQELAAEAEADGPDRVDLAPDAWSIAAVHRRTRRIAGASALVAACVVAAVVATTTQQLDHRPPIHSTISSPSPSEPANDGPQLAPARSAEPSLPFLSTVLPPSIDTSKTPVAGLPSLASDTGRASRRPRRVDRRLRDARPDRGRRLGRQGAAPGRRPPRLGGRHGRQPVVAAGQRVAGADRSPRSLRAEGCRRRRRPPVRHLLPTGDPRSQPARHLVTRGRLPAGLGRQRVHGRHGGHSQDGARGGDGPLRCRDPPRGGQWQYLEPGSTAHIDQWWGQAFTSGPRAALGAFSSGLHVEGAPTADPQVLAVVDVNHPTDERLLAFDWTGRYKGCCAALGWLDKDTVVFSSAGGNDPVRILAWNLKTKAVSRVSEVSNNSVISLAIGRPG